MRKHFILFVTALLTLTSGLKAQVITGKVVNADQEPLIGVVVKGGNNKTGVTTDVDGFFRLNLGKDAKYPIQVKINYVGYDPYDLDIYEETDNVGTIVLRTERFSLDGVVVVAYGSQKRRDLTGAVSSVDGKELLKNPITSLEQSLEGKLSGVQVTQATGAPGGAVVINVRGTSSISAGNEPLYVVDGLPVVSKDLSDIGGYQGNSLSGIADINPNDIASVEVLKDASAAALYGSRASNGVILITTKKGAAGRTKVTLDSYIGVQNLWKKLDYLNAEEYVEARNEAIDNYNNSLGLSPSDATYKKHVSAAVPGADTNWLDEITHNGLQTNHQLTISGGNDRTLFYASGGYYKQEGAIINTGYERYNLRTNISHQVNKRIHVDANIALSTSDTRRATGDNNIFSPWINALSVSPDFSIYDADGNYGNVNNSRRNPVQLIKEEPQSSKKYRALVNLKGSLEIHPELHYHINLGGDYNILHELQVWPSTSLQGASVNGETVDGRAFTFTHLAEHTLDYNHSWGALNLKALAGYSYQKTTVDNAYVDGINFVSPSLIYLDSAGEITYGGSYVEKNALQSYFARANLSYADRYLLELSFRSDASSKFSPDNRVGYFPAASAGWQVSQEKFWKENKAVNDLKLRASIGYTGNQEGIGNYEYHQTYSASGVKYNGNSGYSFPTYKPNPNLSWEKTLQYDLGFDAVLLNRRIELIFDWYKKDTHDLLLTHSINSLSGYSSTTSNVGDITNTGLELSITSHNLTGQFKWDSRLNFTYAKNEVTGLVKNAEGEEPYITTGYCNILQVGESMAAFFMIQADGIYQSKEEILAQPGGQKLWDKGIRPGDVKYFDKNADGVINSEDRVISGSPFPKFFGSLSNNFSYKGFDLSIDLQYAIGAKLYAAWKANGTGGGNQGGHANAYGILRSEWDNRWTESNPSGDKPRAVAYGAAYENNILNYTTRYLENADFLKIRNLSLGYTLPVSLTKQFGINHLRLYATVHNLYTFTGYDGFDPEVAMFPTRTTYRGYDSGSVPQLRSYVFGINLTF